MSTLADRIAARKARKARREAEEAAASGRAAEPREPVAPPPAPPRERRRPSATAVPARRPSAAAVADRRDARSAPLPERVERLARATEGVDVSDSLRARIERRRRSSGRAEAPRAAEPPPRCSFSETSLEALRKDQREFVTERGWGQFHTPRSLALAMVGEVGEVCELLHILYRF